jgi:hypothetical protein
MSIRKALAIRKKFTLEQQQFVSEKKIDGEYTAAKWIDFLEEIAEFDSYVDVAKEKTQNWAIGFGVGTFFSLFSFAFLNVLALVPVLCLLSLCLVYTTMYWSLRRVDIPNRMRLFMFPLVRLLQEEMKPDTLISLKADLTTGMNKPYFVRESRKDVPRGKVTSYFYDYPILELKTKLADGNSLQIFVSDFARRSEARRSNARGKTKTKTKYKIKTTMQVVLTAKTETYQVQKIPAQPKVRKELHYELKNNKHILNLRKTEISTAEESIPTLNSVLELIAKGYQLLKN